MHLCPTLVLLAAPLALLACSSNYHPEYHPVTVSNFSQNIAYPAPSGPVGSTVYVVPAAAAPPVVVVPSLPPGPEAPPPDFFK